MSATAITRDPQHVGFQADETVCSAPPSTGRMNLLRHQKSWQASHQIEPQDSLVQIRLNNKKRKLSPSHPLEELQNLVLAKRNRPHRRVQFDMTATQVHRRDITDDELRAAWMSPLESALVKQRLINVIMQFCAGVLDDSQDTIRGVEYRVVNGMALRKALAARQYRQAMLALASDKNVHIDFLAQVGTSMSERAAKDARQLADFDFQEAWEDILGLVNNC